MNTNLNNNVKSENKGVESTMNNGVNNNVLNNEKEVVNMTVVELKGIAKEMGLKGYSKLKKAELIALIESNKETKEEVVEMNNTVVANKESKEVKEVVNMKNNMNRINFETIRQMINNECTEEQIANTLKIIANKAKKKSRLRFNIIKKASKQIRVINTLRIEHGITYGLVGQKRVPQLETKVFVQPSQESALLRQCNIKKGKLADSIMVSDGLFVDEVVTVGFTKSIMGQAPKIKTLFEQAINSIFDTSKFARLGDSFGLKNRRTTNLIFNKTTGLVRFSWSTNVKLREDEYMITYDFMGITPSGLRSASLLAAGVQRRDNETTINCDRRETLLEAAMDGAYVCNFKTDDKKAFKTVSKLDKLFKDSTRITQCAPGSQEIMEMKNYIVVNNISEKATFNGELADDVTDGNVLIATEALMDNYYRPNKIDVNYSDVNGTCAQYRGASLKCSGTATRRRHLVTEAKFVMTKTNFTNKKVNGKAVEAFAVVDGKKMSPEEFNKLSYDEQAKFFKKIEMLGDLQAFKLSNFNPKFTLVKLKEAYASDSKTNMVVNMAMLQVAPEEAKEFLIRRSKKQLAEHFKALGVQFDISEKGNVIPRALNFDVVKSLNNSAQFIDYIYKCDAATISALLPGAIRSIIANSIKGLRKVVNELKIDFDSKYMVVQSDRAAVFQRTVLQEDEIFCQDFDVKRVSAVRHPISSTYAITTFNVVDLEEVTRRIGDLQLGVAQKEAIFDFYASAKGYVILPASKYLMQKHDGMDWDIDAMQIILDQEAVNLLGRIRNVGSIINSKNDWMRKVTLNAENNIAEGKYERPTMELEAPKAKDDSDQSETAAALEEAFQGSVYSYDFSFIGRYVAKDFFMSEVANVGEIATAFYNNVCILSALKSKSVSKEYKEAIVKEFNELYKCTGKVEYKSVIKFEKSGKKEQYDSNKMDCCEAIFRFADSNGTQEELELFLEDCCYLNRFLAETSIDAAKNRFFVMNMFNHADIVRALGSDKNMAINVTTNRDNAKVIFEESFNRLGLSNTCVESNNFFNVEMLEAKKKGAALEDLEGARAEAMRIAMIKGVDPKPVALAVADPLAEIRLGLVDFANDLIVLTSKLLENHINTLDSKSIRSNVQEEAHEVINNSYAEYHINAVLYGIKNAYAAITTSAQETDEFEGKATKEYLNTVAIQGCRNMAKMALADVDDYTIGLAVIATMSKEDGTSTINPALFKIFEREIVAFLAAKGINNMGFVGENLMYASNDEGLVKLETLIGQTVEIEHGVGVTEDGTVVRTKDKKATIAGTIVEDEGHIVVKAERQYKEDNMSVGAYFNLDTRKNKAVNNTIIIGETDCNLDQFVPVAYQIKKEWTSKKNGRKYYNVVVAYNEEGHYMIEGCMTANKNIVDILSEMNLTTENFKVFTSEKGSRVFFLGGEECEAIISALEYQAQDSVDVFEGQAFAPTMSDEESTVATEPNFEELEASMEDMAKEFGLSEPTFA